MNPFNDIVELGKVEEETKALTFGPWSDPTPMSDCVGFSRMTDFCS